MPTAFISVSHKAKRLGALARLLDEKAWWIMATEGTAHYIQRHASVRSIPVETMTGFPPLFGGRVKTLHPKIFGGVLAKESHRAQADKHHIQLIDLVVADFYPFLETVQSGASEADCVDRIDIGGPALVLAAAKNHDRVTVLVDPADYQQVIDEISAHGSTHPATRARLAFKAEEHVIRYQLTVHHWRKSRNGAPLDPTPEDPFKDLYAGGKLAKKF